MRVVMIGLLAILFPATAPAERGDWYVERNTDELRDTTTVTAATYPTEGPRNTNLRVACHRDNLNVGIATAESVRGRTVRYRFDDGEIRTVEWEAARLEGLSLLLAPESKGMAERLAQHQKVVFEVKTTGLDKQWIFSLDGSAAAIAKVREACGM